MVPSDGPVVTAQELVKQPLQNDLTLNAHVAQRERVQRRVAVTGSDRLGICVASEFARLQQAKYATERTLSSDFCSNLLPI